MLIDFELCKSLLADHKIQVKGILHIGAHICEEKDAYNKGGISDNRIYWIEGNKSLVDRLQQLNIPNVYWGIIDQDEKIVKFNVTNNYASSSILDLGTHKNYYTDIYYTHSFEEKSIRLDNLVTQNDIPINLLNFWNLDIQGNELSALKSGEKFLKYADAIYCEVNVEHVYKNCALISDIDAFLLPHGFVRLQTYIAAGVGWGDALYVRMLPCTIPE